MKKTLALVLAFALVFSTMTFAFAEEAAISADAKICADLGMLVGDGNGVTATYTATAPTRIQSAVMFLRLKGLYADAIKFAGTDNFADGNIAWAEGKNLLAYLKANPQLGWQGDGKNFSPNNPITAKEYYKVMLQALGYVQSSATVAGGDFSWDNVIEFAATKGLTKVASVASFTINDVAVATVEALKANMKEGGKTLVASLVAAGKVDAAKATAAGIYTAAPTAPAVAVDEAVAVGNAVVEVTYEADVDAAAAGNVANYAIAGLEIKSVVVTGSDTVRLETAAMTKGTVYTLTVGEKSVKFAGVSKSSTAPALTSADSNDVEEVVLTFTKNMDFATSTDVANYTIDGVEIVSATVDANEVTLTTKGLAARKQYTVKVKNVKSVDGVLLKSDSDSFYAKLDTVAPHVDGIQAETYERLVVTFSEKVTQESAEEVANYTIKTVSGDVELKVLDAVWDDDDEDKVTLTTETQAANKKYELAVLNVTDQTNRANKITKASKFEFYGVKEDTTAPTFTSAAAISRTQIKVTFSDGASKLDPATILDAANYTLKKASTEYAIEKVEELSNDWKSYSALITVEDMGTGSFSLEAEAIADEFGNEFSSSVTKNFTVGVGTYASSTVNNMVFADTTKSPSLVDGKHITLTFDKPLNEDSAEDIANYSLDGDIGSPIKATYTEDETLSPAEYYVVLETNKLVAGCEYDLTVKGVTDLAGNSLDLLIEDQIGTGWDSSAVALEDAYAVNKYVVALSFDDTVADIVGSNITSTLVLRDTKTVSPSPDVTLTSLDLKDDDTTVVFSAYPGTNLVDDVTYYVYSVVYSVYSGITDLAGNEFVYTTPATAANAEFLVQGTSSAPEHVTVDSIEQLDGKTFKVLFSGNVTAPGTIGSWTVTDNTDKDNDLRFTLTSGTLQDDPGYYEVNLSQYVTDLHGIPVYDSGDEDTDDSDLTRLYVDYEDDSDHTPYIVSVTAVDRTHIDVVYSERMTDIGASTWAAMFKVKNADSDVSDTEVSVTATLGSDKKTVTLVLSPSNALQSIYDYELLIKARSARDVAGNTAEELTTDTFSFNGTDLAHSPLVP